MFHRKCTFLFGILVFTSTIVSNQSWALAKAIDQVNCDKGTKDNQLECCYSQIVGQMDCSSKDKNADCIQLCNNPDVAMCGTGKTWQENAKQCKDICNKLYPKVTNQTF